MTEQNKIKLLLFNKTYYFQIPSLSFASKWWFTRIEYSMKHGISRIEYIVSRNMYAEWNVEYGTWSIQNGICSMKYAE